MHPIHFLKEALLPHALYLGKQVICLKANGQVAGNVPSEKPCRLLILGKHTYFETVASLPINDLKEIKAAMAIDTSSYAPFATKLFFVRVLQRQPQRTLVNLWFVRPDAIDDRLLADAWLIVPETALWAMSADHRPCLDIIHGTEEGNQLMVYVNGSGAVRSTLSGPADQQLDFFRRALGPEGSQCTENHISDQQDYFGMLMKKFGSAPLTDLHPFFELRLKRNPMQTKAVRRAVYVFIFILAAYVAIWALLPLSVERRMVAENEQLNAALGPILDRQNQLDKNHREIGLLAAPMEAYVAKSQLFEILHDTLAGQATVSRMTISANRVELRGTAATATEVLAALSAVPGVQDVQLMSPLTKDRRTGKDSFVISFVARSGSSKQPNAAEQD